MDSDLAKLRAVRCHGIFHHLHRRPGRSLGFDRRLSSLLQYGCVGLAARIPGAKQSTVTRFQIFIFRVLKRRIRSLLRQFQQIPVDLFHRRSHRCDSRCGLIRAAGHHRSVRQAGIAVLKGNPIQRQAETIRSVLNLYRRRTHPHFTRRSLHNRRAVRAYPHPSFRWKTEIRIIGRRNTLPDQPFSIPLGAQLRVA